MSIRDCQKHLKIIIIHNIITSLYLLFKKNLLQMHKDIVPLCLLHQRYTRKLLVKRSPEARSARWLSGPPASLMRRNGPAAPEQMNEHPDKDIYLCTEAFLHTWPSVDVISVSKIGGDMHCFSIIVFFLLLKDVNSWNWSCKIRRVLGNYD